MSLKPARVCFTEMTLILFMLADAARVCYAMACIAAKRNPERMIRMLCTAGCIHISGNAN